MGLISGRCPECWTSLKISDKATAQLTCPYCGAANINLYLNKDFLIKDGVLEKYIGESVDVVIPTTVREIADRVFSNVKIETVKIPDSVTSIGDYAFYGCWSLTSIVVDENNSKYDSRNNCNAIIEKSSNTLILGCKNTTIPDSVTSIGDYAFYCCRGSTSITIGNSVTSIGDGAFSFCTSLTNITIGDSVTSIGYRAFYDCSSLTNITIGDCVTSIGVGVFSHCSSLTSITIPNSVTSIGGAFDGCDSLTSIVVEENNSKYDSRNNCNAIIEKSSNTLLLGCKNTTIPDGVTSIGDGAFIGCSNLTSITIPDSITSIGYGAFFGCGNLTSITIPDSATSIGEKAFYDCSSLTSINFKGTMDQWDAISKGSRWNSNTGSYIIYCTDGEIAKS